MDGVSRKMNETFVDILLALPFFMLALLWFMWKKHSIDMDDDPILILFSILFCILFALAVILSIILMLLVPFALHHIGF